MAEPSNSNGLMYNSVTVYLHQSSSQCLLSLCGVTQIGRRWKGVFATLQLFGPTNMQEY